jgi:hypothetical protein
MTSGRLSRRGFLGGLLAGAAIAAVPLVRGLTLWGDGVHDDSEALQALLDGLPVWRPDGSLYETTKRGLIRADGLLCRMTRGLTINAGPERVLHGGKYIFEPQSEGYWCSVQDYGKISLEFLDIDVRVPPDRSFSVGVFRYSALAPDSSLPRNSRMFYVDQATPFRIA